MKNIRIFGNTRQEPMALNAIMEQHKKVDIIMADSTGRLYLARIPRTNDKPVKGFTLSVLSQDRLCPLLYTNRCNDKYIDFNGIGILIKYLDDSNNTHMPIYSISGPIKYGNFNSIIGYSEENVQQDIAVLGKIALVYDEEDPNVSMGIYKKYGPNLVRDLLSNDKFDQAISIIDAMSKVTITDFQCSAEDNKSPLSKKMKELREIYRKG